MLSQEWICARPASAGEKLFGVPDARWERFEAMSQCGMEWERVRLAVGMAVRI